VRRTGIRFLLASKIKFLGVDRITLAFLNGALLLVVDAILLINNSAFINI